MVLGVVSGQEKVREVSTNQQLAIGGVFPKNALGVLWCMLMQAEMFGPY